MPTFKNIGLAIYDILRNDSNVNTYVEGRIYPNKSEPNAAFPFIIYSTQSTNPSNTKDGASITDAVELQISVFSKTYKEATNIKQRVRQALDYVAGGTYNTLVLQSISFDNENSDYEDDILPDGVYVKTQIYNCRIIFS